MLWKDGEGKREVVFLYISRLYINCSKVQGGKEDRWVASLQVKVTGKNEGTVRA